MNIEALPKSTLVALCQSLVRTPSVNGKQSEHPVAALVADFARGAGLNVKIVAAEPNRHSLLIHAGPDRPADLILVGHLDTVDVGTLLRWRYPPFSGTVVEGKLYGRGAYDSKSGLVAALGALLLVQKLPEAEQPSVLLVAVPDGESGVTRRPGIRHLYSLGLLKGKAAIYCCSGNDKLILGHRGFLRLSIETIGSMQHTGSTNWQDSPSDSNTVATMIDILHRLKNIRFPTQGTGLFASLRTVITPTSITGGSVGLVPENCQATVEVWLVPTASQDSVLSAIEKVLRDVALRQQSLQVMVRQEVSFPPTEISAEEPIVRAVRQAVQENLGRTLELSVSGEANESYLLNEIGIPTCMVGPTGENAHAANEHVVIDSLFDTAAIYARSALLLRL